MLQVKTDHVTLTKSQERQVVLQAMCQVLSNLDACPADKQEHFVEEAMIAEELYQELIEEMQEFGVCLYNDPQDTHYYQDPPSDYEKWNDAFDSAKDECRSFAKAILVTGHDELDGYEFYMAVATIDNGETEDGADYLIKAEKGHPLSKDQLQEAAAIARVAGQNFGEKKEDEGEGVEVFLKGGMPESIERDDEGVLKDSFSNRISSLITKELPAHEAAVLLKHSEIVHIGKDDFVAA